MTRRSGSEADFQAQVVKLAAALGYRHYHQHYALGSDRGFPDLVLCNPTQHRIVWIELKGPRGVLSDAQREWLDLLKRCGEEAYVFYPNDMDEIIKVLRRKA